MAPSEPSTGASSKAAGEHLTSPCYTSGIAQEALDALASANLADPSPIQQARVILEQIAEFTRSCQSPTELSSVLPGTCGEPKGTEAPHGGFRHWNAERRYRALVEKIPAVTFMAALDDTVHDLYISPQIEAMLGFSQKQWLDNPFLWYTQLHPEDRERWAAEFARTCATGVQFRSEYRLIARDGRVVWIHGECQVVKDETGRPLFLQGIAFDITESKRAEEILRRAHDELDARVRERTIELARANEALRAEVAERKTIEAELLRSMKEAEAAKKAKDQFLAVLSHELRTPLTPVLSTVQMLEREENLPPGTHDAIAMVRRNVELEARLIDDLLDLTRITRGKIQLHPEPVDAHESLRHAVQICQAQIDDKEPELIFSLCATQRHVCADRTRLQQMLWNLVSNAVKFTPRHGRITFHSSNDDQGRLVIQITDTGVGIAPETLPRLFNAFEQGEQTVNRRFGGLGLGLMITRALAELHNGSILAESAGTDQGATFTLRLKSMPAPALAEPCEVLTPSASPQPVDQAARQCILLVEDNEDTLRVMARALKSFGYEVHTATDVKSALALAEKQEFNLLVSDIGLPDGSGWDIMRQLRHKQSLRGIALSGYGMDDDLRKSREAGFEHHLVKPINFDMLQNAIAEVSSK